MVLPGLWKSDHPLQAAHAGAKARAREATARHRKKRQAEFRQIIRVAKSQPCADCGGSWPYYVMQFDHARGEKNFGIATAIGKVGQITVQALREEIAKCDVVCANCHALRHRGTAWRNRVTVQSRARPMA
jgi:hypothetical protein